MKKNIQKKNAYMCKTESLCCTAEIGRHCKSTKLQLRKRAIKEKNLGPEREGGREMQEGRHMALYVYVYLIHFVIKQKLTHHCKTIILQ